jgi:anti-sigma factor RsiW
MNQDPRTPGLHPDAELASFVDGSAGEADRRMVEAHLATCAACRSDVEFALQGHAAMQALPEIDVPEALTEVLRFLPHAGAEKSGDGVRPVATGQAVRERRLRRSSGSTRWERVAWGAGLAAAASLVAVFVFFGSNGGGNQLATKDAGAPAAQPGPRTFGGTETLTNYDRASLDDLARQLARARTSIAAGGTTATAGQPGPTLDQAEAGQALACLRRGAGLASGAAATYLESASFEGKPAFIGAFPVGVSGGTPTNLLVESVDQTNCQPLYVVTLPL